MRLLFNRVGILIDVWQGPFEFFTGHTTSPQYRLLRAPHGFLAFSALLVLRSSRNFNRALCNCDLLFPTEHPTISAISLCS